MKPVLSYSFLFHSTNITFTKNKHYVYDRETYCLGGENNRFSTREYKKNDNK